MRGTVKKYTNKSKYTGLLKNRWSMKKVEGGIGTKPPMEHGKTMQKDAEYQK